MTYAYMANLKTLFKRLFPTREAFREYLAWRDERRVLAERMHKSRVAKEMRRQEIGVMTSDSDDDDFDSMSDKIWDEMNDV